MYEFVHTKLGFCFWDIPALIVLIAIIAVFVVHVIRQKRRENEFEDELSDKMAQKAAAENAKSIVYFRGGACSNRNTLHL